MKQLLFLVAVSIWANLASATITKNDPIIWDGGNAGRIIAPGGLNVTQSSASQITVGNTTSTAQSTIYGGLSVMTNTVSSSTYTVDSSTTDNVIYTNSASNAIAITLPAPTKGRTLTFFDSAGTAGTYNVTIKQHSAETINGLTQIVLASNYAGTTLTSNGTNWFAETIPTSGIVIYTSGTSFTTPVNTTPQTRWKFTVVGGGGGGGGGTASRGYSTAGGGGCTGILQTTGLSANTAYAMAIGSGGTTASGAAGGTGGTSSITIGSTTYSATGGGGGAVGPEANSTAGGAGGTCSNFTLSIPGQAGGACPVSTAASVGPVGGNSFMGIGGGSVPNPPSGSSNGNTGTGYGAGGGGGAASTTSPSAWTGGSGAQGLVMGEYWN